MSVISTRSAGGRPSKLPMAGSIWITCPPPSIMAEACWMGVILTTPAEVLNSSAWRAAKADDTNADRVSNNVVVFIRCIVRLGSPAQRQGSAAQRGHFLAQRLHRPREDGLVGAAEIIQVLEAAVRVVAMLGAAAVADGLILARGAFRMRDGLLRREAVALLPPRDLRPGIDLHVAQPPVLLDEKIARIHVAVVLHHRVTVAGFVHRAGAGLLPGQRFGDVVEVADAHAAPLRPPQLEGLQQEAAVLPGGDGEGQRLPLPVEFGERNVLDRIDAQRAEEAVDLARLFDVRLAEYAQRAELDAIFLERLQPAHHVPPRARATFIDAIAVVHRLGAVQGDAGHPFILLEQSAPGVVEQDSVSLDGVRDGLAAPPVAFLQLDHLFEEGQARQG